VNGYLVSAQKKSIPATKLAAACLVVLFKARDILLFRKLKIHEKNVSSLCGITGEKSHTLISGRPPVAPTETPLAFTGFHISNFKATGGRPNQMHQFPIIFSFHIL
jgi:hypothetical protein